MYQVMKTKQFEKWFKKIKNARNRGIINVRIREIAIKGELCGDWKSLGEGLFELRFFIGPGYRVYFSLLNGMLLLLLLGGDKTTQALDTRKARNLLKQLRRHYET